MRTIERGIYFSLCLHLYDAGGRISNKTAFLAEICGFPPGQEDIFVQHFNRIKNKFVQKSTYLVHHRCTKELEKAYHITQARRKGGLMTAEMRKNTNIIPSREMQVSCNGAVAHLQQLDETRTRQDKNRTNTSDKHINEARNINPIFKKTLDSIKVSDSLLKSSSSSSSSRSPQSHESREGDKVPTAVKIY